MFLKGTCISVYEYNKQACSDTEVVFLIYYLRHWCANIWGLLAITIKPYTHLVFKHLTLVLAVDHEVP